MGVSYVLICRPEFVKWRLIMLLGRDISLRNAISREMLVNTLIHRELKSYFIVKSVVEQEKCMLKILPVFSGVHANFIGGKVECIFFRRYNMFLGNP